MLIEEHNLPDLDRTLHERSIIKSIAAERFDENLLFKIPQAKGVILVDDANPFLERMHGQELNAIVSLARIELEDDLHLGGHYEINIEPDTHSN